MKTRKILVTMLIACAMLSGCGKKTSISSIPSTSNATYASKDESVSDEAESVQADYMICVDGVDVGINFYDGYKPYVFVFRSKEDEAIGCEAFFKTVEENRTNMSMDDAKQKEIIYDYQYDRQNGILVFYIKETEKLNLMPITFNYEIEFETVDAYDFLWNDAALAKIGLGGVYHMADVFPSEEFTEDDKVCVKKVICEHYRYAPMGSNILMNFMFVVDERPMDYTEIDAE